MLKPFLLLLYSSTCGGDAALDACSSDTPTHNTRAVVCMYDDDPNTYEFNVDTQQSDSRPLGLTPIYAVRTDGRVECIGHGDEMRSTSVETALPSPSHPTSMHRALYTMEKWFSHKAGDVW